MLETTLQQVNSHGRIKQAWFGLSDATLHRKWGLLDGAQQATDHTYGFINKGKKNQLTPQGAATADYHRVIAKKCKEGYRITASDYEINAFPEGWIATGADIEQVLNEDPTLDFTFEVIPSEFCVSKPRKKISTKQEAIIDEALRNGTARIEHKVNGICHFVLFTASGDVKIYTRRMDDHTLKYPALVKDFKDLKDSNVFPAETILVFELTVQGHMSMPHMTAFKKVTEISKVDTVKGVLKPDLTESYARQEAMPVQAVIYSAVYWAGEPVWQNKTQAEILRLYRRHFKSAATNDTVCLPARMPVLSLEAARQELKKLGEHCEGAVVWMLDESMEVTFNGKPNRRASFKLKILHETDVVAYDWVEGKGDRQGKIGALKIGVYGTEGNLVELGTVGSGIEDNQADPALWEFPCVVEIAYDNRYPTGRFQFARFIKVHEDKAVEEV